MNAKTNSQAPNAETILPILPDAASLFDIGRLLFVLKEFWLGAVLTAVVLCSATTFILLRQVPIYAANSALLIEHNADNVLDIKKVVDETVDAQLTDSLILTHIQQIQGHSFLMRLTGELSKEDKIALIKPYVGSSLGLFGRKIFLEGLSDEAITVTAQRLIKKNLSAERIGKTLLIALTFKHRDPKVAQKMSNTAAFAYVNYLITRADIKNDNALKFLLSKTENLKKRVEDEENAIQKYRAEYQMLSSEENQALILERMRTFASSYTVAHVNRQNAEHRLDQLEKLLTESEDPRRVIGVLGLPNLTSLQNQIEGLEQRRMSLSSRFGRLHPTMQEIDATLVELRASLKQQIAESIANLRLELDRYRGQEQSLDSAIGDLKKESIHLADLTLKFDAMKRVLETDKQIYQQVLSRENETSLSTELRNTNIMVADNAAFPDKPNIPNIPKTMGIVATLAVFILIAYPLARDKMEARLVRNRGDIEGYLGQKYLGGIPENQEFQNILTADMIAKSTNVVLTDTFRALSTRCLEVIGESHRRIMITSTLPGEGKSFFSTLLAASLAAHGKKTLIVDLDLRKPVQHVNFGLDNKRGVLTYLTSGYKSHVDLLTNSDLGIVEHSPNLFILRAGGTSRRASELLANKDLSELLETLGREFDVLLLDTPPTGLVPDAEAVARFADDCIYVSRFKHAPRAHIRSVIIRLRLTKVNFLGLVLNALPESSLRQGAYGTYEYYGSKYYMSSPS